MRTTILVLANQTATSDELLETLTTRGSNTPIRLELVVPPVGPDPACRSEAEQQLDEALRRMNDAGLEATGLVGDSDPLAAVLEVYEPTRHDEIMVSTLPASISRWMGFDLPARVGRATGALVTHVAVPEAEARRRSLSGQRAER